MRIGDLISSSTQRKLREAIQPQPPTFEEECAFCEGMGATWTEAGYTMCPECRGECKIKRLGVNPNRITEEVDRQARRIRYGRRAR